MPTTETTSERLWQIVNRGTFLLAVATLGAVLLNWKNDAVQDHIINGLHRPENFSALEARVTVLEKQEFTAMDGRDLEARIMDRVPPKWFREDVQEIKKGIDRLDSRMTSFDLRIRELEQNRDSDQ